MIGRLVISNLLFNNYGECQYKRLELVQGGITMLKEERNTLESILREEFNVTQIGCNPNKGYQYKFVGYRVALANLMPLNRAKKLLRLTNLSRGVGDEFYIKADNLNRNNLSDRVFVMLVSATNVNITAEQVIREFLLSPKSILSEFVSVTEEDRKNLFELDSVMKEFYTAPVIGQLARNIHTIIDKLCYWKYPVQLLLSDEVIKRNKDRRQLETLIDKLDKMGQVDSRVKRKKVIEYGGIIYQLVGLPRTFTLDNDEPFLYIKGLRDGDERRLNSEAEDLRKHFMHIATHLGAIDYSDIKGIFNLDIKRVILSETVEDLKSLSEDVRNYKFYSDDLRDIKLEILMKNSNCTALDIYKAFKEDGYDVQGIIEDVLRKFLDAGTDSALLSLEIPILQDLFEILMGVLVLNDLKLEYEFKEDLGEVVQDLYQALVNLPKITKLDVPSCLPQPNYNSLEEYKNSLLELNDGIKKYRRV